MVYLYFIFVLLLILFPGFLKHKNGRTYSTTWTKCNVPVDRNLGTTSGNMVFM